MEIINVIEIRKGILDNVQSFPILHESDKNEIVQRAEKMFTDKAMSNGAEESDWDIEDLLDSGNFDNENGYEVIITWSDVNLNIKNLDNFIESVDIQQD